MRKNAFTLAEVLITLGVIGIVAALTIPGLLNNYYEKSTISKLRETQSILSQAVKMAEEEYGDVEGWELTGENQASALIAIEKIKPFIKIAQDCGAKDPNHMCVPEQYYKKNGNKHDIAYYNSGGYYKFTLFNGASIMVHTPVNQSTRADDILGFYVDTNGISRPNKIGTDLFYFIYGKNALRPLGALDSTFPYDIYCLPQNSTGWGCTYYVLEKNNMRYPH